MNLRQKYKKAKRELERYKNSPINPKIIDQDLRILSPRCYIEVGSDIDISEDEVKERIMKQLSVCVKHYIQFTKETSPSGNIIYGGKLRIVDYDVE